MPRVIAGSPPFAPFAAASEELCMRVRSIPQVYRNVNRWGEILSILSKYGLADWLSRFEFAFGKSWLKNRDGRKLTDESRERRIRHALEELGPTFIKLGQIMSTRPDLVG
ncbi:MAG: hypothetical protein AAF961_03205, partial [Planctomycetota bacterium]